MTVPLFWKLLFWAWVGSEIIVGITTRTKPSTGEVRDRGSLRILWVVIASSVTACQWISASTPPNMLGGAPSLRIAAVVVLLLGLAIRWTAIFTLGKSFSSNVAIGASQRITETGLYRFVRHPSYLGLWLAFLAIGLHSRNWTSFAIVLVPTTLALLYRIRVEEAALGEAFGDDYRAYCKATKRLLPGVY
jgi:protein-S-isoprenylcysteine O-methyltransferase